VPFGGSYVTPLNRSAAAVLRGDVDAGWFMPSLCVLLSLGCCWAAEDARRLGFPG
jgi:hypothetical protein